jgi:HupE / UreJ protein
MSVLRRQYTLSRPIVRSVLRRFPGGACLVLAAALASLCTNVAAHEIPGDVTVQAWLKPEGQRLRLLVRVPLVAMRDINYPTRGDKTLGILDLAQAESVLRDAATLWVGEAIDVYEGDTRLSLPALLEVRPSLPSDRSFTSSYDEALAHLTGPRLPNDTDLPWSSGVLDLFFEYPIQSDRSPFSVDSRLDRLGLRTITVLRLVLPDGAVRAFEFVGTTGFVRLDPRWHQAALQFVKLGFSHILDGVDHLLFLFCLVIPFRRLRALVAVVTAFTVAHSITLFASAYNLAPDALWFPPLIETLIATSIVYMALENIVGASPEPQNPQSSSLRRPTKSPATAWQAPATPTLTPSFLSEGGVKRRWAIAFGFGLVHGFGFSFALRQTLQFAGSHLLTSLLSFNIGVELGQLLVLVALMPALELLFKYVVAERMGTIILSALITHTAWHWMTERAAILRQFRFEWPVLDVLFWASALRWMMLVVIAAGLYWLVFGVFKAQLRKPSREPAVSAEEIS